MSTEQRINLLGCIAAWAAISAPWYLGVIEIFRWLL